jgi:hypothetical protein
MSLSLIRHTVKINPEVAIVVTVLQDYKQISYRRLYEYFHSKLFRCNLGIV